MGGGLAMIGALTFLTGSKLGRLAAIGLLLAVAFGLAWRARLKQGRAQAEADALAAKADRAMEMVDAVRRMGDAQAAAPRDRRAVLERLRNGAG